MTYFNRGDFGEDRERKPSLYDAVCAKCGSTCKVPFRPNGRKEVFCSKCFEEIGGGEPRSSRGVDRFYDRRQERVYRKPAFNAICDKCGVNCTVPFEPKNGKPVLCDECFGKNDNGTGTSRGVTPTVDLGEINAKLDKIIELLTPTAPKEISKKIIETIETNLGKEVARSKKKTRTGKKG